MEFLIPLLIGAAVIAGYRYWLKRKGPTEPPAPVRVQSGGPGSTPPPPEGGGSDGGEP